ncbi:allantoinase AllB [Luteimicrobium subarcticum]|uniref:allantoinase n=1 Tax=Luteimicrobium subarcticum TaxID=620910 RepID=A0A2M8WUK7_9MICO|nr:allantoinase AllB [Luteimicrobium subarcticum]PJI94622.1 allantoinase [Luteimicrobium subarcticum]
MTQQPPGPSPDLVVRARRAWVDTAWASVQVHVVGGEVAAVDAFDAPLPAGVPVTDVSADQVLLPGLVDSHVHVNEPGRTAWEGFASATRAAAAGGVTTLVDMPLNSIPPTTTPDALDAKLAATAGKLTVDVAFWGGAVPDNLGALAPLHDAGVRGFKAFLAPSGVDEFGHLGPDELDRALSEVAALDSVLVVHAEDPHHLVAPPGDGRLGARYADFLASRPPTSEQAAIARLLDGVARTGARAHVLHLSDAGALPLLRAAKASGLPVTVETCPHYLTLRAEDVPDGATQFKCCPPIRSAANQDLLWEAVLDGTIDAVVSDHSPATTDLKHADGGDFGRSWGGIAGLQLGLPAVWTEARRRGIPLDALLPAFTTGPARVAGLDGREPGEAPLGRIVPGAPAHLVALDPEAEFVVDARRLEHRNPDSPYDGATLHGAVRTVWLGGRPVVADGHVLAGAPRGRTLLALRTTAAPTTAARA